MHPVTLRHHDGNDRVLTTRFTGELIGHVSFERNVRRGSWWRRTFSWDVYRADEGKIILYRSWREILSNDWDGAIGFFEDLPTLLSQIHERVGRDGGPLAELRKALLVGSLASNGDGL